MFFSVCSPVSSKVSSSRLPMLSLTEPETATPPGLAMLSIRAAMLTPSPKMSPSSMMMSQRLTPMRNSTRLSCGTSALRSRILCWMSAAQATALTTLGNSTSKPSPVSLTILP